MAKISVAPSPKQAHQGAGKSCSQFTEAAGLFQALSDETRLAILDYLRQRPEVCACEFAGCCGLAQPTVSYHLKILREAGLVEADKRGSWVYYRLNKKKMEEIREILQ
ncbi:MAG: metalloregulator ArsR/SmtB family transcription factor [Actinomycetota bacterium]|nr:metalloregulator ArsR/SmtB family transcription factor [Actinomycetota bacterium]MDD5668169.1 metalloregulator ArsR/SmtB family transcription factor [Actinomycetota bacterium]